jgi:hypothetical protein
MAGRLPFKEKLSRFDSGRGYQFFPNRGVEGDTGASLKIIQRIKISIYNPKTLYYIF